MEEKQIMTPQNEQTQLEKQIQREKFLSMCYFIHSYVLWQLE